MDDTSNLSARIGIAIRGRRKAKGLTQLELADLADVNSTMISHIENGRRNANFNLNALERISIALGTKLSTFIARAESIGDLPTELAKTKKKLRQIQRQLS